MYRALLLTKKQRWEAEFFNNTAALSLRNGPFAPFGVCEWTLCPAGRVGCGFGGEAAASCANTKGGWGEGGCAGVLNRWHPWLTAAKSRLPWSDSKTPTRASSLAVCLSVLLHLCCTGSSWLIINFAAPPPLNTKLVVCVHGWLCTNACVWPPTFLFVYASVCVWVGERVNMQGL